MEVTFITGNSNKVDGVKRYLDYPITHQKLDLPEIQSLDLQEIIERKAKEAYKQIKKPVLVEDTSLTFHALGKLPGPLIKWFFEELGNDGLCTLLDGYTDRSVTAEVCYGLCDGDLFQTFGGSTKGIIADTPRGQTDFSWDPIFIPEGCEKTWAEMDFTEQAETSMRKKALEKLEIALKS